MFNVNVVISASPELLDVLKRLAGIVAPATPSSNGNGNAMSAVHTSDTHTAPAATKPAAASKPAAAPAAEVQTGSSQNGAVTLRQLQASVVAKAQAGKLPDVKALLTKFEVAKVTELPAEKFAAFYSELEKIKVA